MQGMRIVRSGLSTACGYRKSLPYLHLGKSRLDGPAQFRTLPAMQLNNLQRYGGEQCFKLSKCRIHKHSGGERRCPVLPFCKLGNKLCCLFGAHPAAALCKHKPDNIHR
ncbi:hypothetical protein D3C75_1012880 [compost metagenome]